MKPLWKWLGLALFAALVVGLAWRITQNRAAKNAAAAQTQAPKPPLQLGPGDTLELQTRGLSRQLRVSGSLKATQTALLKAKVAAELKTLTVREGDAVTAGQALGALDSTEFDLRLAQAQQSAQAARAQLDIAQRALDNNRALVGQGFISSTALDTSVANAAAAQANWLAAQAAVDLARKARQDTQLLAPISGWVSARLAQAGERLGVDARVLEIVDLRQLELEAPIPAEDAAGLQVGQSAQLTVAGHPQPYPARVVRVNPSAQAGSRAVLAYLSLPAAPGLRQGLFAQGHIELSVRQALAIPLSAVRLEGAQPSVLTLESGRVQQRKVQLGEQGLPTAAQAEAGRIGAEEQSGLEQWVEVRAGLQPGTVVILASAGALREGTPAQGPTAPRR
jgi:membrane fusion protein (multidrug efflux system)